MLPEGRQANERRDIILKSVDAFIKVHDKWEADINGPTQPSERFERAVEICVDLCRAGDTPADCHGLVAAVAKMGTEWILYRGGKMNSEHCPTKAFWDAVREVKFERIGAVPFKPRTRESVAMLLSQKVSPEQIARANYGDPEWPNGYGPFLGSRGEVDYKALEAEAAANAKGETTLPADWIHPDDRSRKRVAEDNARTRLAQLEQEIGRSEEKSKEDPEKLLREGQYANVVARVCNMPLDDVLALAERLQIQVDSTPNLAAMRAPSEPAIHEASDRALQPRTDVPDAGEGELPQGAGPERQVADLAARGMDAEQIAEHLGLSPKKVEKLLQATPV